MNNLLVIEDDKRIAELLKKGLGNFGFEVTISYDGKSAKETLTGSSFDLIITDIILPGISGIELCKSIKKSNSEIPIIMLTALGSTDDKLEGFDAGADDYMVKPFDIRELNARIKVLLKRKKNNKENNKLTYKDLNLNLDTRTVERGSSEIKLTPKEFNLLKYLMENKERIIPRSEIAEKVCDTHFDTGTNFIDVYINYLRKKVDKNYPDKLIHTRQGMGFILKSES